MSTRAQARADTSVRRLENDPGGLPDKVIGRALGEELRRGT